MTERRSWLRDSENWRRDVIRATCVHDWIRGIAQNHAHPNGFKFGFEESCFAKVFTVLIL